MTETKRSKDLLEQRETEIKNNKTESENRFGSAIKYGDVVQLRHVKSKKFLTLLFVIAKG